MAGKEKFFEAMRAIQNIFPMVKAEEKGQGIVEIRIDDSDTIQKKNLLGFCLVAVGFCISVCRYNVNGLLGEKNIEIAECTGILPEGSAILIVKKEKSLPIVTMRAPCGKRLQEAMEKSQFKISDN